MARVVPPPRRAALTAAVALLTLLLHTALAVTTMTSPDFRKYPEAARLLARGEMNAERQLDFSPLYLGVHRIAARLLANPAPAIHWLQRLLVALAAALLFRLLAAWFPTGLALLGTAAFALDRSLVLYTQALEPEALLVFCLSAFAWALLKPSRPAPLAAGFFLALACLTRQNFLPLALLVPVWLRFREPEKREWRKASALFLLPLLLAVAGLALRQTRLAGALTVMAQNPGYVLFEGNNPCSSGQSAIYSPLVDELVDEMPGLPDPHHEAYRRVARQSSNRPLTVPEVNAWWSLRAGAFVLDHPGRFLGLALKRLNFFFHTFRRHDLGDVQENDRRLALAGIPLFPFAPVSALALAGLLLARRRWLEWLPLYGLFFLQLALLALTYVSARQRVAVLGSFVFFACAALSGIGRRLRTWAAPAAALLLSLLLLPESDLMREERHIWESFRLANASLARVRTERAADRPLAAARLAVIAQALLPANRDGLRPAEMSFEPLGYWPNALHAGRLLPAATASQRFDRATLALQAGSGPEAEAGFRQLLDEGREFKRDFRQSSRPEYYLARLAHERGDIPRSTALARRALEKSPGDPFALAWLHAVANDPEPARLLERYFSPLDADLLLGLALLDTRQFQRALPRLERLCASLPEYRRGRILLAVALAGCGEPERAASLFLSAQAQRPGPLPCEPEILALFRTRAQRAPERLQPRLEYGRVLRAYGRFGESLRVQRECASLFPGQPGPTAEIAWLERALAGLQTRGG